MKKMYGMMAMLAMALGLTFAACDAVDDAIDQIKDVKTPGDEITGDTDPGDDSITGLDTDPGEDTTVCTPDCAGKVCGPDGCGGTCGVCEAGVPCNNGLCVCTPQCTGKECGPDGCGGTCGDCDAGSSCDAGICCTPSCTGKECGPDGCGGICGTCTDGAVCNAGTCEVEQEMGCADIFDCLNACPMGDRGCQTNCVNAAPIEAQMAFNAVVQCLDNSGYFDCAEGDQECLKTTSDLCEDEIVVCFAGDLSCKDMYLCVVNCPNDATGEACVQDCLGEGNAEAQYLWNDFIGCLDEKGYFDCAEGDTECYGAAWDQCMTEFRACVHGDTGCMEILDCLNTCPPTSEICALECQVNGTVAAQEAFEALVDCVIETCGEDDSAECQNQALQGACGTLFAACQGM